MKVSQETDLFGSRLRELRLARKKRLREVADAIGVTEGYLSRVEVGTRRNVSPDVLKGLASYYGVTENWLISGEEEDALMIAKVNLEKTIEQSGLQGNAEKILSQLAAWLRFFITSDNLGRQAAMPRLMEALEKFSTECAEKNGAVREASLALARVTFSRAYTETIVDISNVVEDDSLQMQRWLKLRARVKALLSSHGSKTDLAERLHVSRQMLHRYIEGNSAPNAEIALQMLEWVAAEEGKQKSPEGAGTPPEPVTQKRKSVHEKPTPGRPPK